MLQILVVLGLIASAWYLLIVRPQRDRHGRHAALISQIAPGTHVMTVGGIYGRVSALEGSTVVIEIAPGMETRVAVDGIARIAHGTEAALPQHTQDQHMQHDHQHQHAHHDVPPLPHVSVPPQPFVQQAQHHVSTHAATAPVHVPSITIRASVPQQQLQGSPGMDVSAPHISTLGSPSYHVEPPAGTRAPVWAPRPWKAPGFDTEMRVSTQPIAQHHAIELPALPPAPQSFSTPGAYAAPVVHPAPVSYPAPTMQHAQSAYPAPTPYVPPVHHSHAHHAQVQPTPVYVEEPQRRHSQAPDGMGGSVKLSDPKLRDQVVRARREREELAEEYQRLLAPYVAEQHVPQPASPYMQHAPSSHLFAHGHVAAPPSSVYPSPAVPPQVGASSEPGFPGVGIAHEPHPAEAAFDRGAFQRNAPYSAQPAS